MCVVLVYFLTVPMSIFDFFYAGRYIVDFVNKTSHDKGGERAQMETVQSDTVGFYPR